MGVNEMINPVERLNFVAVVQSAILLPQSWGRQIATRGFLSSSATIRQGTSRFSVHSRADIVVALGSRTHSHSTLKHTDL